MKPAIKAALTLCLLCAVVVLAQGKSKVAPSGSTFTDPRDGQTYRTVKIGGAVWMAQNLNYNASGSVCYDNQAGNCTKYGRLYDWATVMDLPAGCNSSSCAGQVQSPHRGICPAGWHVPSDAEWEALVKYVDPNASGGHSTVAGMKLKSKTGWHTGSGYNPGTDEYGFSALPGGSGYGGEFRDAGSTGCWWSATDTEYGDDGYAWSRDMGYYGHEYVLCQGNNDKEARFALRCRQDARP